LAYCRKQESVGGTPDNYLIPGGGIGIFSRFDWTIGRLRRSISLEVVLMATIRFMVNGKVRSVETDLDRPLLDVLREDLGLTGTKYGCGEGQCRACTVLMDGKAIASCITPVRLAQGKKIVTIEGLAGSGLHPVQQAFLDEDAMQCGYCTPGMIMRTVSLLESNSKPTEEQIIEALNGNLCRCSGYVRVIAAVKRAAATIQGTPEEAGHVK
jgi:aerobic-type carbon monoxide dehydrogenase small subunit (CoxS/CutS family)